MHLNFLYRLILCAIIFFAPTLAAAAPVRILAFGDSLFAGYGLEAEKGFTHELERQVAKAGIEASVQNAGVSGDTTSGGLARMDWTLSAPEAPDLVLLELGANDALRGVDPALTRANLDAMITKLREKKLPVLLVGMRAVRNWGGAFSTQFDAIYPDLAKKYDLPLYAFYLEGVAGEARYNQPDGLHPNAEGVALIVRKMLPTVQKALKNK